MFKLGEYKQGEYKALMGPSTRLSGVPIGIPGKFDGSTAARS